MEIYLAKNFFGQEKNFDCVKFKKRYNDLYKRTFNSTRESWETQKTHQKKVQLEKRI